MSFKSLIGLAFLFAFSQMAIASLVCKDARKEFIIKETPAGFTITLTDLIARKMSSIEELKKMRPNADTNFLEKIAARFGKDPNQGKMDLGTCEIMDACQFEALASENPVTCLRETDKFSAKLEILHSDDSLQLRCASVGIFEISNAMVKDTMTGEGTKTLSLKFKPNACKFEK